MKRITTFVVLMLLMTLFCACSDKNETASDALIDVKSSDEAINLSNNDNYNALYIGRPTCSDCEAFEPLLIEAIQHNSYQVYYYDTDLFREDGGYSKVLDTYEIDEVPALLIVGKGEFAKLDDYSNTEAIIQFLDEMK